MADKQTLEYLKEAAVLRGNQIFFDTTTKNELGLEGDEDIVQLKKIRN